MQTAELYEFNKCRGIPTSASSNYNSSHCNFMLDAIWLVLIVTGWWLNESYSWAELAWYVPSRPLIQPVRILDQTGGLWWWQGHWASHSRTSHPAPSHCCSPICFSTALRGNQDSDTLWERGRQKDLHTMPDRGISNLPPEFVPKWTSTKVKGIKFEFLETNCLHSFASDYSEWCDHYSDHFFCSAECISKNIYFISVTFI